jgi:hypothetical protein
MEFGAEPSRVASNSLGNGVLGWPRLVANFIAAHFVRRVAGVERTRSPPACSRWGRMSTFDPSHPRVSRARVFGDCGELVSQNKVRVEPIFQDVVALRQREFPASADFDVAVGL